MMYTPTPGARRPRPPGSLKNRQSLKKVDAPKRETEAHRGIPELCASSSVSPSESPIATYAQRRNKTRTTLSRVSASPGEVGDVSLGLDVDLENEDDAENVEREATLSTSPQPNIGLGLSSSLKFPGQKDEAQPSPPPPYGQDLPSNPPIPRQGYTPPRHGTDTPCRLPSARKTRVRTEERLRARRATDAARAIGLNVDFEESDGEQGGSEGDLSPGEMRAKLKDMKRHLMHRNNGKCRVE
jgi:hypothetical protein